jgi:hypothetical protein
MITGSFGVFSGYEVILDSNLVEKHEDFSQVRSRSRAKRRYKHKQNIKYFYTAMPEIFNFGNKLLMHPEVFKKLS